MKHHPATAGLTSSLVEAVKKSQKLTEAKQETSAPSGRWANIATATTAAAAGAWLAPRPARMAAAGAWYLCAGNPAPCT
jgi:hypothetical protein